MDARAGEVGIELNVIVTTGALVFGLQNGAVRTGDRVAVDTRPRSGSADRFEDEPGRQIIGHGHAGEERRRAGVADRDEVRVARAGQDRTVDVVDLVDGDAAPDA